MEWNVIYFDGDKIGTFNIFNHTRFKKEVDELLRLKSISKEDFTEELCRSLRYYFWSKAEWEILIRAWCGGNGNEEVKIDVWEQIMWNLDRFVDYIWSFRKK